MDESHPRLEHLSNNSISQSTNNARATLLDDMHLLSLSTAATTALPPSSPAAPVMASLENSGHCSSSGLNQSTRSPLRRPPSSTSLGGSDRSITPTLHKRASLGSLQGSGGGTPPRSPASRRTSSHLASSTGPGLAVRSHLSPPVEEPQPPPATAASVAHEFFKKELNIHQSGAGKAEEAQTIVILQDDCYGHRFSRPRTSKTNLSLIVERPERLHASILGLATAYVRLGGRHAEGGAPPHPQKHPSTLPSVPFKIHKTARRLSLKSPAAVAIHGAKWMNELSAMCDAAESKLALSGKELSRPSTVDQANGKTQADRSKLHEGDLYLCAESLNALEGALGGVCEGIDTVFQDRGPKRAFVCIRPPGHHCSADMPSGFCWLNNIHVGIGHAALSHGLTHAAIIDFDLHHGDGSQSITWDHNSRISSMPKNTSIVKKTAIGYFSLHDINSYPCEMGDEEKVRNASLCIENAHGQNIWNVHLQPWKTEAEFWQLYEERYSVVLSKARSFLRAHSDRLRQAPTHPKPKAAIFLSAGFDASEWESPGMQRHQVNVPTDFYARLTRDIVSIAEEECLGVDGRIISVLEGGYSDRALMSGILSHLSGLATTPRTSKPSTNPDGLGYEMGRKLGRLDLDDNSMHTQNDPRKEDVEIYDSKWWSPTHLEELEALTSPPAPAVALKKQRHDARPTYTSATQSYTAKIVSPPQGRRSISGSGGILNQQGLPTRPPSPPPPEVYWATAAHELSKLLVPSDRETRSCKPEDLNAEASRARRDRYSSIGLPADAPIVDPKRMQLRDRKAKPLQYISDDEAKPLSRATRRKTIPDVSLLDVELSAAAVDYANAPQPSRPARRRSSVASTASSATAERGSELGLGTANGTTIGREQLLIKKSRGAANPRQEAPKVQAIRKQAAVSRAPSISSASSNPENQMTGNQDIIKAPLAVNVEMEHEDVDQLASGMKKMSIKLNVPPKHEYEARETKAKAAPRGRPAKPSTSKIMKPVSPTKSKAKFVKGSSPPKPMLNEPLAIQQLPPHASYSEHARGTGEPVLEPKPPVQLLHHAAQTSEGKAHTSLVLPSGTPATAPARNSIVATSEDSSRHVPDQEQTNTDSSKFTPHSSMLQQPLSDLSLPGTPVTAKRIKQELPIFTSTSPISFSKSNVITSDIGQTMYSNGDANQKAMIRSSPPFNGQPAVAGAIDQQTGMPSEPFSSRNSLTGMNVKQEPQDPVSIWDIPETPKPFKP